MRLTKAQQDLARKHQLNLSTVHKRIQSGWDVYDALTEPVGDRSVKATLEWNGITLSKDELEIANDNDISRKVIRQRLSAGMSVEDAINTPLSERTQPKNDIGEHELKMIIGRIKHLRAIERDFPIPVPKPLLRKAEALGVEISKIKPIPVEEDKIHAN